MRFETGILAIAALLTIAANPTQPRLLDHQIVEVAQGKKISDSHALRQEYEKLKGSQQKQGESGQSEEPYCVQYFYRPTKDPEYFKVVAEPNVYVVPYDKGVPAESYDGDDKYLANVYRGGRVPPYVEIICYADYLMNFKFNGLEALQFLQIQPTRYIRYDEQFRYMLTMKVYLPPTATGEYVISSAENPQLKTSFFIFAEKNETPYLMGRGKTQYGTVNATHVVIPCIAFNRNTSISLHWKDSEGFYRRVFNNSQKNNWAMQYDPKRGFILARTVIGSNRDLEGLEYPFKAGYDFPFGEYTCRTEWWNIWGDQVFAIVTQNPPPPKNITNNGLKFDIVQSPSSALCTGPTGTRVKLTRFVANHFEGPELIRCLLERGSPCGTEAQKRDTGLTFNEVAGVTALPDNALLICTSNTGLVNHVYYFKGLSGTYYAEPWQNVPSTELLRPNLIAKLEPGQTELIQGQEANFSCDAAGDFIPNPLVFAKFKNMSGKKEYVTSLPTGSVVTLKLEPDLEELICNLQFWDPTEPISASVRTNVKHIPCAFDQWECKNLRCIASTSRCDEYNDCADNSDEDLNECAEAFKPRVPLIWKGQGEVHANPSEVVPLACYAQVNHTWGSDEPKFKWYRGEQEIMIPTDPDHTYNDIDLGPSQLTKPDPLRREKIVNVLEVVATVDEVYTCVASNKWGSDSAMFSIKVREPCPEPSNTVKHIQPRPTPSVNHRKPIKTDPTPTATAAEHSFTCTAEGKHRDPQNCGIYHECVQTNEEPSYYSKFLHYQFTCGLGTVFCEQNQVCGYEQDCPCNHLRKKVAAAAVEFNRQ